MAKKKMVTTAEAAEMLGKSIRTVRVYCEDGMLEAEREGKAWQIVKKSVKEYAKELKKIERQKAKKGAR